MQRYHASSCTSAVNNNSFGGPSTIGRTDSSSLPASFPVNSRRQPPLNFNTYKLKCEKEPLNSRLGPPDFHPQTPTCPEETLTREYLLSGYRDTVEGLEEAREILLTQIPHFNKTAVLNCKEAIKKRLRAINESRVQKRKAGQVYGVALSGPQLAKSGLFPEHRPCPEDFRRKWIEGLSQQHKRLRSLADLVPQYRRKSVLEVLIRNNVPFLRATWFVKVTYLNLVRSGSASASGTNDKNQLSCAELWTKDVIEYLQTLLDEFFSKKTSHSIPHSRDRSPQMPYITSLQHRSGQVLPVSDGEEPSLHFRWWYIVRLLQWHHAEGLLLPSLVIDWVLHQLQEKQLLEVWQLLLPIVYGFLEFIALSQTYVRNLAGVALQIIRDPAPGGLDLVDNSRRAYTTAALIEMLRYLILAVPETFVALDCFPLPSFVVSHTINDGSFVPKATEASGKINNSSEDVMCIFRSKGLDAQYQSLAFGHVLLCIQKQAENLTKAVSSGYSGQSLAKAAQALDKSLLHGDIRGAYKFLFEDLCDGTVSEGWVANVSACLRLSLRWFVNVNTSLVYSVFFLCEWATCDFRDFRTGPPCDIKFTGKKDLSQVHIAVRILKMKLKDMQTSQRKRNGSTRRVNCLAKCSSQQNNLNFMNNASRVKSSSKSMNQNICSSAIFESPGPLHDIIVCWIDQHVVHKGEGLKRLHLFIVELIRAGIFYPLAYVRQLIVSGIVDTNVNVVDPERQKRHCRILKQLPGNSICDALEESGIIEGPLLIEALQVYLNERRLILRGSLSENHGNGGSATLSGVKRKFFTSSSSAKDGSVSIDQRKTVPSNKISSKILKDDTSVEELKTAISVLLQLPKSVSNMSATGSDESQGSVKRPIRSNSKIDVMEATPGCEECRRAKKQKLSDDRSSFVQTHSPLLVDEEDTWWVKKGLKSLEPLKVDQPLKTTKQVTKSRQKTVRKTQSLAQLAASRIEGSQGASTSHVCDNKVSCPHHRTAMDGDMMRSVDGIRTSQCEDIVSTGKALKRLRFLEKKEITVWLMTSVRQLIEETEKNIGKVGQFGRPLATVDDRSSIRWKLADDELSAILHLMDTSDDLVSAVKFLLWLLPKVCSSSTSTIQSGRNVLMPQRNVENQVCNVGEAFLLSSLRRYENILAAADLIPEALSSAMHRATAIIASNGRVSGSGALAFAHYLLKKYSSMTSVIDWEKNFKTTCDKRLASELESGRSVGGELGLPLGVPAGVEDPDDFFRQKISGGRLPSRVGSGMKDVVQRNVEEAFHYLFGKDRKLYAAGTPKGHALEKWDNGYQIAQQIVMGLMDCIRQTGGAAQEGDPSLVTSAVSAIVGSVGPTLAKLPDFSAGNNHSNTSLATGSLSYAKCILRMHITCLCLLKEALGERQSRVFEIALATEASSALAGVFAPSKASRTQFQMSPETHDSSAAMSYDAVNSSSKIVLARTTKIAAAVSALIVGAIIYGVTSLERMVTILRLKEGLDVVQFVRCSRSSSNGSARSVGAIKVDSSVEVHVQWFRLLVGNCRTICEGLVVDLLGEQSIVALSRMQRMLPLTVVFPPAYSIFAFVMWRPFIMNANVAAREDLNQLYQSLTMAISDAIKHLPFRDVCFRDCQGLYDLMTADKSDAEFAKFLQLNGSDMRLNSMAFVPLRARNFLNAMIDCKMPQSIYTKDDGSRISGHGEPKIHLMDSESKLQDKLVDVLDALQSAKFHWQWVELRLLLNEQALIEKLQTHDISLSDAIQLSLPSSEKGAASENENNFIQIIFTRLLVRPDAAPLFSELIHLFGKSLEDSMLMQAKWFLGGQDVLFGRKTIRQRLINIAENKGFSVKAQFSEPWGWCSPCTDPMTMKGDKRKADSQSLEEGEVVEEGMDVKRSTKGFSRVFHTEGSTSKQQHGTERALIELILPCIDQSSDESRNSFASDLIKQLSYIEQQIAALTRGPGKPAASAPVVEGQTNKASTRKSIRGGSPGLARRPTPAADTSPPSPAALRASMSLRVQLIMRFLPILCTDREPSARNMRHTLASVVLRLLGSQIVYEDTNVLVNAIHGSLSRREVESPSEAACAASVDSSVEGLFDCLLLILHGLLSSSPPIWLRLKSVSKTTNEHTREFSIFDRELLETLQNHLESMQLPDTIRWCIQAAMPVLPPSTRCAFSCQPPSVATSALLSLNHSITNSGSSLTSPQRNPIPLLRTTASGKSKQQDSDFEVDPWTLLEDGAGSCPSASNIGSSDRVDIRAASWLKGAVRVRRTDLTYVGAVDEDS